MAIGAFALGPTVAGSAGGDDAVGYICGVEHARFVPEAAGDLGPEPCEVDADNCVPTRCKGDGPPPADEELAIIAGYAVLLKPGSAVCPC